MKILMLGWELPPHNSGGLGVACFHLAKALASRGANIDFVLPYQAQHPASNFMTIHSATPLSPLERCGLGAYDSKNVITKLLDEADLDNLRDIRGVQKRYCHFVKQLAYQTQPDVIHAHDWLTIEAGIQAKQVTGAPLIVHVHATEFDRAGSDSGNPLVHEIEYTGLVMADRIIAVSQLTKDLIVEKYQIPADKVEVLHHGFDTEYFDDGYRYDDATYRYLEMLKNEGFTVISVVSRLTIQKGLYHFMKAAAKACSRFDKLAFLIAGDGEQRDELINLSADLGISDRVFFAGFVRGKIWRDAYSVSDVFVMSSVSEPFGLTALEAAHHDNAIILTRQSGVSEVLNSVFRYDYWDEDILADRIIGLATLPTLKSSMIQDVKNEYARLSWQAVATKLIGLYNSINERVAG